jgi:DNA-binding transcriptional ArsR family regulator
LNCDYRCRRSRSSGTKQWMTSSRLLPRIRLPSSETEICRAHRFGGPSVSKALSLLEAMGLVIRRDVGNKTLYRINERQLREIDDTFLEIPQAEFREPLRRFANRITE